MPQWEYDYMILKGKLDDIVDIWDEKGLQGWELVTVITRISKTRTGDTKQIDIAIFKRPCTT